MGPIRLIRSTSELHGTCYFEFLPGPYRDKCWNEGSVFLEEEVFGLVEPIIARHEPQFDHFAFVNIRRTTWERIIAELDQVSKSSDNREVSAMMAELVAWLREQLTHEQCISVLGI